ncbi:MAG: hypothetical protein AAGA60_26075 [Cyanobacteria bacterium P01_E01_bin.42]
MTLNKDIPSAQKLRSMAKCAADYENKDESERALIILNEIITYIEEERVSVNKKFKGWVYAHKGEALSQLMIKAIKMADDLFYSGYKVGATLVLWEVTSKKHFRGKVVKAFEKAIESYEQAGYTNDSCYYWAINRLGEAYRQRALAFFFWRKIYDKAAHEVADFLPKKDEIEDLIKEGLTEARDEFSKVADQDENGYWNYAHLGATYYYLARYKLTDEEVVDYWRNQDCGLEKFINKTALDKAKENLEKADIIALNSKLLYPWSKLFLSAIYAIEAKLKDDNDGDSQTLWQKALITFIITLEQDPAIMMPNKSLTMLRLFQANSLISRIEPDIQTRESINLESGLQQAKEYTRDALMRNPDFAIVSYLDGTRDSYFELQDKAEST